MRHAAMIPAMALSMLLLAGCAELRTPPVVQPVPVALLPPATDPLRAAARMAAADFAEEGAAVQNRPAEAARAMGRLEWLTAVLSTDQRYDALPPGIAMALRGGTAEVREALGMVADTPPAQATAALTAIARQIDAGQSPDFPAALFPGGAERSLQRLTRPGPLPQAAIATGQAAEVIARLDQTGGWNRGAGETPRF
ncbi:hypothetical protein [Roseomonas haemaphysalidis]|uniref:Uncharacterized protein n=2 Tax=Roseomonas haemaphysalidis TaxID=2768162 RepID=A0ABS3KNK1_9PROT|nr:hypothetical protein [Roseomonas haemaphysalidis]MBO1079045.1 hypothetical protein [Roseomonas haemaphysalidis]